MASGPLSVPANYEWAANRNLSAVYGTPGVSGKVTVSGSDVATSALTGGKLYMLYSTNDAFINVNAAAVADGTCMFLPGGVQIGLVLGARGTSPVLHAIQVASGGTLYFTQMTEVST